MDNRDRIIEGAAELFKTYGMRSVTMDFLANHLGMSKRTIYEIFSDKDELLIGEKGRLNEPALFAPKLPFATQDAVASQEHDRVVEDVRLAIVLVIGVQDVVDRVGVTQQIEVSAGQGPQPHEVSQFALDPGV